MKNILSKSNSYIAWVTSKFTHGIVMKEGNIRGSLFNNTNKPYVCSRYFLSTGILLISSSAYATHYTSTYSQNLLLDDDILTSGNNVHGWDVSNLTAPNAAGNNKIITTGNDAFGLRFFNTNPRPDGFKALTATGLTIETSGARSDGIHVSTDNQQYVGPDSFTSLNITDSNITTQGDAADGLILQKSSNLTLNNTNVSVSGVNSHALVIASQEPNAGGSIARINGGNFTSTGNINPLASYGAGTVAVSGNSELYMNDAIVKNLGTGGAGVSVIRSKAILSGNTSIETNADGYTGSNGFSSAALYVGRPGSEVTVQTPVKIISRGKNAKGISNYGAVVNVDAATVSTYGVGGFGVQTNEGTTTLNGTSVETHADNATGLYATQYTSGFGTIKTSNVKINTFGNKSNAITVDGNGKVIFNNNDSLSTIGSESHGISFQKGAQESLSNSNIPNAITVTGSDSALIQVIDPNSQLNINNLTFNRKDLNPWGILAENGGKVIIGSNTNLNGNALWAKGSTNPAVINIEGTNNNLSESLVRVDDFGIFNISNISSTDHNLQISALESSENNEDGEVILGADSINQRSLSLGGFEKSDYSGKISGYGDLIFNGTGTQTFSGVDTFGFTGNIYINSGKLAIAGSSQALNKKLIFSGSGVLDTSLSTNGFTVGNIISKNTGDGVIHLGNSSLIVNADDNNNSEFSGQISGDGGTLIKNGTSTLTLSGESVFDYTGDTIVNAGTLNVGQDATASQKNFTINNDGTLNIANANNGFMVGMITGMGLVNLGDQNLTIDGNYSGSYSGTIAGTGSLIKTGNGTLKLSGDNAFAYTGQTLINSGVLALDNVIPNSFSKDFTLNGGWLDLSESNVIPDENSANHWNNITITRGVNAGQGGVIGSNDYINFEVPTDEVNNVNYTIGDPNSLKGRGLFVVKTGTGTLELTGNNTYVGNTRIDNGILRVSADSNLGDTTVAREVVLNGGELNVTHGFNTNRLLQLRQNGVVNVDSNVNTVWHGATGSDQVLTKQGEGQLAFSGASSLAGVVLNNGKLDMGQASITSNTEHAVIIHQGTVSFDKGLLNSTGDIIFADGDNTVNLSNTIINAGSTGSLYHLTNGGNGTINASDQLLDGMITADGPNTHLSLNLISNSSYAGNLVRRGGGTADLYISDGNSTWYVKNNSGVNNLSNNGLIIFSSPSNEIYKSLKVDNNYIGGGIVQLNTELNVGGSLNNQHTDRLLIEGNVSGQTKLKLVTSGDGANTNLGLNDKLIPTEGISLVQVGGNSSADAFSIDNNGKDYVVGNNNAYQYRLFSYGPGETDQSQSLLNNKLGWDYRLETAYLDENGNPVPGDKPHHSEPGGKRKAIVPQGSSYLVAGLALQNYNLSILDSINNRLGEVRRNKFNDANGTAEVFSRAIFSSSDYHSNRAWSDYGYDFDQSINALQVGGNWLHLTNYQGDLRLGLAGTVGSSTVKPKTSAIEYSKLSINARSLALTGSWQQNEGWYIDSVLSYDMYDGTVSTNNSGSDKVDAKGFSFSLEGGKRFELVNGLVLQPQTQLIGQEIKFQNKLDSNAMEIQMHDARFLTSRTGLRMSFPLVGMDSWEPYVRTSYQHTWSETPSVSLAQNEFSQSQVGSAVQVAVGANGQISPTLSVYGELSKQYSIGGYGTNTGNGTLGIRYSF